MPAFLSAKEAAAVAGVSERTVRRWLASGHLKAVKRGRTFAISPEALSAVSGQDGYANGQLTDSGQDSGHAPGVVELIALVREQQQTILELAGRVGFYQAQVQQLQAALEAPKEEPSNRLDTAPKPTPPAEAVSRPSTRAWWRFWGS